MDVFDPDLGRWFTWDRNEKGRPDLDALWEPDLECVWMPVYLRVDSLPANIVTEICLASAALPFGIVPPVEVNGVSYVDGGVVDNVPLHPFVEEFPLDEVFVVLLDSFKSDAAARKDARLTVSNWSKDSGQSRSANSHIQRQFNLFPGISTCRTASKTSLRK